MFRRRFGFRLIVFCVLIAVGGAILWVRSERPVNVLLITLDTTRADHLGCYGRQSALTPNMDQAAADGVLFERAYATAPITLPSHASLFSGLYPPEHGIRTNGRGKYSAPNPLLSDVLSQANYDTGGFVASFVLDAKFGLNRGFAVYNDAIHDTSHSDDLLHRERNGSAVVNVALNWLKKPRSRPFYCWVHLYDPHAPYQLHPEEFGVQFQKRPYDAEIAYVDRQIGRLLSYLKQAQLESNTLVVIVGDHGEGLGDHVEENHGYTLYNSTQHVPLIFKWPGKITSGLRHPHPVSLVDVLPTICDLLRQTTPQDISGRTFAPALRGKSVDPVVCYSATDDPFLQEGWSPQRSLTTERWKYIRTTKPELYDLQNDPGETRNLALSDLARIQEMEQALSELERRMKPQASEGVQLSERELKTLQSLGYLGSSDSHREEIVPDKTLNDVKDMLPFEVDSRIAFEWMNSGKLDQAIAKLKEVVARSSGHAASRVFLGEALEMKGDLTAAVEYYTEALEIKPDHIDALLRLGAVQGRMGNLNEAVRCFDDALKVNPDSIQARLNLGRALLYREQFDEAIGHLEYALKLDSELPGIRLQLSEALRLAGRGKEAMPYLHQELESDPGSVPARMNLAAVLAADEPQQALQYLLEARELNPQNPHLLFQLGETLLTQGRPADAIPYLQQTCRMMPDHPQAAAALERAQLLLQK